MVTDLSRRDVVLSGALGAGLMLGMQRLAGQPAPRAAGAPDDAIRLAFNENPYGPGPAARAAIAGAIADCWKYAVPEEMTLRALIAAREGLTPRHVLIGQGSTEILHMAAVAYGLGGGELVTARPTFNLVADHVRAVGGSVREVALDADLRHDLPAMRAAVTPTTRLVYICNPNNPTGTLLPAAALREFNTSLPKEVALLVDEAYLEFGANPAADSMVGELRAGAHVIVARTFSKLHGLAGLRVGYALARPDVIERLARLKQTVASSLGLAAASASYRDVEFQAATRRLVAEGKAITTAALDELGLRHARSSANFVFFDTGAPVAGFIAAMRQRGFAVGRPFAGYESWCRVSIGTVEQMQAFAAALRLHFAGGRPS